MNADDRLMSEIVIKESTMPTIFDFAATTLDGQSQSLSDFRGKVILVVNTASKCGLTPQFEGLQKIYSDYKDKGLVILGFPCNQFAQQDPASNEEIGAFCSKNYGVEFPMYAKIDVNGEQTHPLFEFLKQSAPGLLGTKRIKWNFTKFLINKDGDVLKRFSPRTSPDQLIDSIEQALSSH